MARHSHPVALKVMNEKALDPKAVESARSAMPRGEGERRLEANLETLCSPVRVKILRALAEQELAAGDLALVVERSRSATSQQLRILREAGAVTARRDGNVVRYRLAGGMTPELLADVAKRLDAA